MLLGALGASLLGNLLIGKQMKLPKASNYTGANIPGQGVITAGEGTIRAGEGTINAASSK